MRINIACFVYTYCMPVGIIKKFCDSPLFLSTFNLIYAVFRKMHLETKEWRHTTRMAHAQTASSYLIYGNNNNNIV